MKISLKKIIVPSIPLAVLLVIGCCSLWIADFFANPESISYNPNSNLTHVFQNFIQPNNYISNIISILVTLLNTLLLAQINNRFTIIRTRTFLPIITFLLLMSTWSVTHIANGSHIALTLFILSLFYFFSMSRDKKSSEQAFMGSILISISSIVFNPFVFFIPIFWIGFMMFQSLSLRTFLASILGTLTPWIIYLSTRYFFSPDYDFSQAFYIPIPNFDLNLSTFTLPVIVYAGATTLTIIIGIIGIYSLTRGDAIQTRNKLNFLVFLLITLFILSIVFKNQFVAFLPIIALVYAILISHPLSLKQNNFYGILFLVFCIINIAFVISKYFLT